MKFLVQAVQKYTAQIDTTEALAIFVGHDKLQEIRTSKLF